MTKLLHSLLMFFPVLIFVYSYGFVDFNLTISSHPAVMSFVGWSQSLALFHRSDSVKVYLGLLAGLFAVYGCALKYFGSHKTISFPWKWVIVAGLIFTFSYPFLSSDVFKYLFSARMVIDYQSNPHLFPPNTFPDDTWIRFMRWVHTPSPYGPVMTGLAIPPYLLGLKKFIPTLILFKLMQVGWYLLSVWLVGRLAAFLTKNKTKISMSRLFFALNPLILIEWLANTHNDAPMIALLLLSLYLLHMGRRFPAFVALVVSAGIKYVTVVLLPFLILKNPKLKIILYYLLFAFASAPLLYHYSWQYQPWYVTWLIPLAAVLGSPSIMWLVGAYSAGAFLRYIPFIATGLWEGTAGYFKILTFGPVAVMGIILVLARLRKHYLK